VREHIIALLAYLASERGLSLSTIAAYRNDLLRFAEYVQEEAPRLRVGAIGRELLRGYLLNLRERGYSAASIARKTAALRALFRYLRVTGEITSDPTVSLGMPDVPMSLRRTVREADVRALFAYCANRHTPEGMRDHAMLSVLRATGMRVGELVNVDVSDVDFVGRRVRVVGRGHRERMLPLDRETLNRIEIYLAHARPVMTRYCVHQAALVVNQRGQRLTRNGFWLIMRHLVRDAGLPMTLTPNTLRYSFASYQIGKGLGLEELRRLLGHASIASTLVYTRTALPQPINVPARRGA
jgi:integrase/recombinase XerD